MKTLITFLLIGLCSPVSTFAQKNCDQDSSGLLPLNDLGSDSYRGFKGGFYPDGSNERPVSHLVQALSQAAMIDPLNASGFPDATNGKIVMIGVGASNPRTEFAAFQNMCDTFTAINQRLEIVNTCIGGQGIQKMNRSDDNYWKQTLHLLDSLTLSPLQVQVAWLETDNTQNADTVFPRAPQALIIDLDTLLHSMHVLFPNLRICYISGRAYSGYVDASMGLEVGKGLLFPRDYYNGWAIKWLIEHQINGEAGYEFNGASAVMPLVTWGSYHWADGANPRSDGLSWNCTTDFGDDGLHLTGLAEQKSGAMIFNYFLNDTTAASWFRKPIPNAIVEYADKNDQAILIQPNPAKDQVTLSIPHTDDHLTITVSDMMGRQMIQQNIITADSQVSLSFDLPSGEYLLSISNDGNTVSRKLIVSK